MVVDQSTGKADQDRRQGGEPRALRHVPDGRGRATAADVPRNSVAHRPAAGAACASMRGRRRPMEQTTTAGVRLDEGKPTSSRLRDGPPDYFAAHGVGCDRISLRRHPGEAQNYPNRPGTRGMSVENAQAMAAHESLRTTKLYDRTADVITLDEVERIVI
jgi:hypothetical protein